MVKALVILLIIFAIFLSSSKGNFFILLFMNPIAVTLLIMILYHIYLKFYKKVRNTGYEIDAYNDIQNLNRDIDCKYPPSVLSILINNSLKLEDISADIMNLYAKKVIEVTKVQEYNKEFYTLKAKADSNLESGLYSSEKYLLYTLIRKFFDFDFSKWSSYVNEDYLSCCFCERKKGFKTQTIYIISLIVCFFVSIACSIYLKDIFSGIFIRINILSFMYNGSYCFF